MQQAEVGDPAWNSRQVGPVAPAQHHQVFGPQLHDKAGHQPPPSGVFFGREHELTSGEARPSGGGCSGRDHGLERVGGRRLGRGGTVPPSAFKDWYRLRLIKGASALPELKIFPRGKLSARRRHSSLVTGSTTSPIKLAARVASSASSAVKAAACGLPPPSRP